MTRLIRIDIDDSALPPATPEMEQERRVAIFDLLEDNSFALPGREGMQAPPGPYALHLAVRDGRLVFEIATDAPGFVIDEPLLELGRALRLPPWLEPSREDIARALPPLHVDPVAPASSLHG